MTSLNLAKSLNQQQHETCENIECLPAWKFRNPFLYCLEKHQVVVLVGKSTTPISQCLYDYGWCTKGNIGILLPRQVSNDGVAVFAINYKRQLSLHKEIKHLTEDVFLSELMQDPLLLQFGVIIVEETERRSLLTDTILGLLKKILVKRTTLKLIISAVAFDAEFFKDFFNLANKKNKDKETSVVLTVEERQNKAEVFYLQEPCSNIVRETVLTVLKIHEKQPPGDILAFLIDHQDVSDAIHLMQEYMSEKSRKTLQIYSLYESLSAYEENKLNAQTPHGVRKVIFGNYKAEAYMSVPGIVYVIDCGLVKVRWYDCHSMAHSYIIGPISKATSRQRFDLVRQMPPGKVFRLFTEEYLQNLPERNTAEIIRSDLSSALLFLKALGIKNILQFQFPSPPPVKNLLASVELLYALNAIDEAGKLTRPEGYILAELPFSPMINKMIYMSSKMGCILEILSIVAMLQISTVHSRKYFQQTTARKVVLKRHFEVAEGDLLFLLNVFTGFIESGKSKQFCGQHFLNYDNLVKALELRTHLLDLVKKKFSFTITSNRATVESICKCITAAFFYNAAYLHHSGMYRNIRTDVELAINPDSTLYGLQQPQYLVYFDLLKTTKIFMNKITVIKQEWLAEMAPHCYANR